MAGSNSGSMADGLKKILSEVAQLSVLPDADLQFLTQLQQVLTQYIRQSASQGHPHGPQGLPPDGAQGGPGGPQGPPPPPQQIAPGGGQGGMSGLAPQMPNPDELRRVLGAGGATQ